MDMTAGVWVAVVVGVASLLWWWNDCWYALPLRLRRGGGSKLPPGYMGLPFLGDMPAFLWYFKALGRPDDYISSKRRNYGDGVGLYRTHLFGTPTIIVCTPSANKFVMQSESNFVVKWSSDELVGKTSLVSVEGAAHTRVRGIVVKAINQPDALRKITLMVQPRVIASLKSWSKRGRITVLKEAKKIIFANTGKYFAGIEEDRVLNSLDELFKGVIGGVRAYPLNFPGTAFRHALQCRRKATEIFREELEKRKKCGEASEPKNDLMESLMQTKDKEGNRLSEDEVLDNIVSLVVAGYTSTAVSLMWGLYYLAKYPDVLLKLRVYTEEHMVLGKKQKGDLITYEEIASCKYTSKVVEEIIRMANVATFIFRTAKNDVEYRGANTDLSCLDDINLEFCSFEKHPTRLLLETGYKIPKGWKVVCWVRYLHTNPDYFEDPLCFNPDRWSEAPMAGSYLVFGGGSRICPGNMFARLNLSIILHYLVVGYRWKLVNPNAEILYLPHPKPADEVEIDITPF